MSRMKALFQSYVYRKWDLSLNSKSKHDNTFVLCPSHCSTRFIATKVALLLAIKHLWLTRHIWRMKVHCKNVHLNKWCNKLFGSTFLFHFLKQLKKKKKTLRKIAWMEAEPKSPDSWVSLKVELFWNKLKLSYSVVWVVCRHAFPFSFMCWGAFAAQSIKKNHIWKSQQQCLYRNNVNPQTSLCTISQGLFLQ